MDFKQLQTLIREFEKSSMTVLELEQEGFKLKLSKNKGDTITKEIVKKEDLDNCEEATPEVHGYEVKSPLVGTFYTTSAPNEKPYVTVGQRVEVGDTLCIIEAMKIMNEITAPVAGIIEAIKVNNGAPVGYDQVLMVIG